MIGDDIAAVLPGLRAQAESMMRDMGQAFDPDGTVTNPRTGVAEKAFTATTDVGKCKIQGTSTTGHDTGAETIKIGDHEFVVVTAGLHRPWDSPLLANGWQWRITAPGPLSDPTLAGAIFQIIRPSGSRKSLATARRYDVVEMPWPRSTP
ncbi:MAG: hypothetical protein JWO46_1809 [Nocardioidaceae bacterium]|nr:hypothetical protein [Nocardioidaceae bacterium]